MSLQVSFHVEAETEYLSELQYLEAELRGLGRRFQLEFQRALRRLRSFPSSGREIAPQIRIVRMRKFRYGIIYSEANEGEILILAIAHERRKPGYWMERS